MLEKILWRMQKQDKLDKISPKKSSATLDKGKLPDYETINN